MRVGIRSQRLRSLHEDWNELGSSRLLPLWPAQRARYFSFSETELANDRFVVTLTLEKLETKATGSEVSSPRAGAGFCSWSNNAVSTSFVKES